MIINASKRSESKHNKRAWNLRLKMNTLSTYIEALQYTEAKPFTEALRVSQFYAVLRFYKL